MVMDCGDSALSAEMSARGAEIGEDRKKNNDVPLIWRVWRIHKWPRHFWKRGEMGVERVDGKLRSN
jgi:hypothetical protein